MVGRGSTCTLMFFVKLWATARLPRRRAKITELRFTSARPVHHKSLEYVFSIDRNSHVITAATQFDDGLASRTCRPVVLFCQCCDLKETEGIRNLSACLSSLNVRDVVAPDANRCFTILANRSTLQDVRRAEKGRTTRIWAIDAVRYRCREFSGFLEKKRS